MSGSLASASDACRNISNVPRGVRPKAWGSHVQAAASKISEAAVASAQATQLGVKLAGKVDLGDAGGSIRSSLKRKRSVVKAKKSSFDTLSESLEEEEKPVEKKAGSDKKAIDPLARFDPEISMDGFIEGEDNLSVVNDSCLNKSRSRSFFDELSADVSPVSDDSNRTGIFKSISVDFGKKKSDAKSQPVNFLSCFPGSNNAKSERRVDEGWLNRCSERDTPTTGNQVEEEKENTLGASEEVLVPDESPKEDSTVNRCISAQHVLAKDNFASDADNLRPTCEEASDTQTPPAKRKKTSLEGNTPAPGEKDPYTLGFDEVDDNFSKSSKRSQKQSFSSSNVKAPETSEDRLKKRLHNDNFVKINLKKKTYVRGKRAMTGAKHRRMEFKRKVAEKEKKAAKPKVCFRCNEEGHWARDCVGNSGDALMPELEDEEAEAFEFPTLEQAAEMAKGLSSRSISSLSTQTAKLFAPVMESTENSGVSADGLFDDADDNLLLEACSKWNPEEQETTGGTGGDDCSNIITPYFEETQPDAECLAELKTAMNKFGFSDFRPGQSEAMLRILRGKSTLVLLSTGAGKSLIYQLPAYLYGERSKAKKSSQNCITIVISPLVSLMEDQVVGVPPGMRAACLHSNLTDTNKKKVADQVKGGKLHFLLVSPEALAGGGGGTFASLLKDLPPIAFVCIDEAHCVSQWSHNFRPAYLRLCRVLRERLGVTTVLGLTATAPKSTVKDISTHLGVSEADGGVVRGQLLPTNLVLSVSKDENRDLALIKLLKGQRFTKCDSIIVYCTRRDECIRVADYIRTFLQDEELSRSDGKKGKRSVSLTAEPYHAGLSPHRRKTVQTHFMSGRLRIVVATVAFGMGIDKSDIRAIIHYNMPKTFESYIQEIGRAGRDGLEAHCHLFLSSEGRDLNELRRHIFANSVDEQSIRKLLDLVFGNNSKMIESSDQSIRSVSRRYVEKAVPVEEAVETLDLPEENISTLLCYLEGDDNNRQWVKLLNPVYCTCKVRCYGGPRQLRATAAQSPPLAAALALARKDGDAQGLEQSALFEFPVVSVAARMGWDSGVVKRELKGLQWSFVNGRYKKSGVLVEFHNLAFHFNALSNLDSDERDRLKNYLHVRTKTRERMELHGLRRVFRAFGAVARATCDDCVDGASLELSEKLKSFVREYFDEEEKTLPANEKQTVVLSQELEASIKADVRQFVMTHSDHRWHGRAVARIFHGIGSPNFPAKQWGKNRRSWRSHLDVDFNALCDVAKKAILEVRGVRR